MYGDRSVPSIDLCLTIYSTGIIVGLLSVPAAYRMSMPATPEQERSQPQRCAGKAVLTVRILLILVLLLILIGFGYVLYADYLQFAGQTYTLYMIGFLVGLSLSGLVFEFETAYQELQAFFCRRKK